MADRPEPQTTSRPRIDVYCFGNLLVTDDGAAIHLLQRLRKLKLPEHVRLKEMALCGLDLLDQLEAQDKLILVDAARFGNPPGTVYRMDWEEVPAGSASLLCGHQLGIQQVIQIAQSLYPERIPKKVVFVGIEGQIFDQFGQELTPEVEQALPRALALVLEEIEQE